MADVTFDFSSITRFARAMKFSAPKFLAAETGGAMMAIGESDIQKMVAEQLSGQKLNIKSKGFRNSFRWKLQPGNKVRVEQGAPAAGKIDQLSLSEYTGAKPFRIFNAGGSIAPARAHTLTILAPGGRNASGKRKFTQADLRAKVRSGEFIIIKTSGGAAIVKPQQKTNKKGELRRGSKVTVIAYLRPNVKESQRIDFFGNFQNNASEHERILGDAADRAIKRTTEAIDREAGAFE